MALKGLSARLSSDGSKVELVAAGKVLQSLTVRPATAQERSFILSTWVRSYLSTVKLLGVSKGLYLQEEPRIAERLWERTLVLVSDDGYTVCGWACGRAGYLFHAYVLPELRGIGVASALIEAATMAKQLGRTHIDCAKPWPFKSTRYMYNPYAYVNEFKDFVH